MCGSHRHHHHRESAGRSETVVPADDLRASDAERERGPEYVLVLVSSAFDGIPWLERVYQAGSLWDASEMGDTADVHCYTPAELERKVETLRRVKVAVETGYDLLAAPAA